METLVSSGEEFGQHRGAEYMLLLRRGVTAAASHLISQPSGPEGGLFEADSETRLEFRPDG